MATRRNLFSRRWRELFPMEDTVILTEIPVCLVISAAAQQGKVALTRCIGLVLKKRMCLYFMSQETLTLLKQKYCNGFRGLLNHGLPSGFSVTKQQFQKQRKSKVVVCCFFIFLSSPSRILSFIQGITFCTKIPHPLPVQSLHKQF